MSESNEKIFTPDILEDLKELDPKIVHELIDLFFKLAPGEIALINEKLQSQDFDGVRKRAHALKSSVANVGGTKMAAICKNIEKDPDLDAVKKLILMLEQEFESLKKELVIYGNAAK